MNMILLGPPGAGKGTQARLLADHYHLVPIATGDLLREEVARATPIGLAVKEIMAGGGFPSDDIVLEMFENRLAALAGQDVLLDGIPRNVEQADKVAEIFARQKRTLDAVIQLKVDDEELINRLASRVICKACGASVSGNVCPCGCKEFIKRPDDTPEAIRTRLEIYNARTHPLVSYYAQQGLLKVVDGMQPIEDVFDQICQRLS